MVKNIFSIPYEEEDFDNHKTLSGWQYKIFDYFSRENQSSNYLYDFSDVWKHKIILEKFSPEKIIPLIPYCKKEKDPVLRKVVEGHMVIKIFKKL